MTSPRRSLCVLMVILGSLVVVSHLRADGIRTWTDTKSKIRIEAAYVKLDDGNVQLLKKNGELVKVPLDQLSTADRAYIAKMLTGDQRPEMDDVAIQRMESGVVYLTTQDDIGRDLSMGSGIVLDRAGLVATNYHVVQDASQVTARFHDGTKVKVQGYLALDQGHDLALLQVESIPKAATPLVLETKLAPKQGDSVLAIGHPRGFSYTFSRGTINAVRQTTELPQQFQQLFPYSKDASWIQTDAVIASGSSGGPLLNDDQHVIGLNTWTLDQSKLGFAIDVKHLVTLKKTLTATSKPRSFPLDRVSSDNPMSPMNADVARLSMEFRRKWEEFVVKLRQTPPKEQRALMATGDPRVIYARKCFDVADQARKTHKALQALVIASQLVSSGMTEQTNELNKAILARLSKDHLDSRIMASVSLGLAGDNTASAREFLRQVLDKSPHHACQGAACIALASNLVRHSQGGHDQQQALKLLERAAGEFGDVPFGNGTLKQVAGPMLHQLKYLSIGSSAQDIHGKDIEGKEFKLSDFKGKVVMLDFFANWCPYCVQMYPHERVLVDKYQDKPFALLGVNTDPEATLRQIVQEKKVTWKTWADGPRGPISSAWNISSFPTIYLLDRQGTIRYVFNGVPGDALEQSIAKLLAEPLVDAEK